MIPHTPTGMPFPNASTAKEVARHGMLRLTSAPWCAKCRLSQAGAVETSAVSLVSNGEMRLQIAKQCVQAMEVWINQQAVPKTIACRR